jgi:hypothetical protein
MPRPWQLFFYQCPAPIALTFVVKRETSWYTFSSVYLFTRQAAIVAYFKVVIVV